MRATKQSRSLTSLGIQIRPKIWIATARTSGPRDDMAKGPSAAASEFPFDPGRSHGDGCALGRVLKLRLSF
jgi:hypothetical protein